MGFEPAVEVVVFQGIRTTETNKKPPVNTTEEATLHFIQVLNWEAY